MGLKEEAEQLCQEIKNEQMRLSRLSWQLEHILFNRRLAVAGFSGIEHRVVRSVAATDEELRQAIEEVRNQWRHASA